MTMRIQNHMYCIYCVFIVINTLLNVTFTYRTCKSPSICTEVWKCPEFKNVLQGSQINKKSVISRIRRTFCGVQKNIPEVCCQYNVTENQNITKSTSTTEINNIQLDVFENLPVKICGEISHGLRITKGVNAAIREFPWMVLIAYKDDESSNTEDFRCGGTLINDRFVLTAAHCINPSILGVRLGEYNTATAIDCDETGLDCDKSVQDILVNKVIVHPDYDDTLLINDIALIKLARPANFTYRNIKPVCLPIDASLSNKELTGRYLTVSGWGITEQGERSTILRKVLIPVQPLSTCRKLYKIYKPITSQQLCAGAYKGRDSCEGDSGGPLMTVDLFMNTPRYIQFGIVSYGPRLCGVDGRPGVYTNVIKYVDWILSSITKS